MTTILFYVFAAIAIAAAIGVVVSRSPVGSYVYLTPIEHVTWPVPENNNNK
jgi:NADH:ubiquinone oxidoreductase subunit 6 (subunit J)